MEHDEHKRQAEFCSSQADNAESEMMKHVWRRLAAYWLSLSRQGRSVTHAIDMFVPDTSDPREPED